MNSGQSIDMEGSGSAKGDASGADSSSAESGNETPVSGRHPKVCVAKGPFTAMVQIHAVDVSMSTRWVCTCD